MWFPWSPPVDLSRLSFHVSAELNLETIECKHVKHTLANVIALTAHVEGLFGNGMKGQARDPVFSGTLISWPLSGVAWQNLHFISMAALSSCQAWLIAEWLPHIASLALSCYKAPTDLAQHQHKR